MPNEILTELTEAIKDRATSEGKSRIMPHVAFAYSYYYYVTYLYRFCKFYDKNGNKVTQKEIKQYLGYSPIYKPLDYIIKRGGVLDSIGYTETTKDVPMTWDTDDFGQIYFTNMVDKNFSIKKPIKAFHRTLESLEEDVTDGTFYDTPNTHRIPFSIFKEFMENDKLQTIGFFLYGYLTHMCNMHSNAFQASYTRMSKETGLHRTTIINYLNAMEDEHLINVIHQEFKFDREDDDEKLANIYSV